MKQPIKKVLLTGGTVFMLSAFVTPLAFTGTVGATSNWQGNHHGDNHSEHITKRQMFRMLDAALREHAAVGVAALKAALLQEPDAEALGNAVAANNEIIADTIEKRYPGTRDQFLALWEQHIEYYKDYLVAAKAGDEAGKEEARQNLANFAEEVSDLLNDANRKLDQDALKEHMGMHGEQVTTIIDYFVAGDYDAAWTTAHEAYEHMGVIADTLAVGKPWQQKHWE